jgi:hypothetical protein
VFEELPRMSRGQQERYTLGQIERLVDQSDLRWLHELAAGRESVQIGVFCCPAGGLPCTDDCDDQCGCCENERLWEWPLLPGRRPVCNCGRTGLLVSVSDDSFPVPADAAPIARRTRARRPVEDSLIAWLEDLTAARYGRGTEEGRRLRRAIRQLRAELEQMRRTGPD